jgi:hypothetical protein
MSSISAEFAQVGRRRGYFIATGTVTQYTLTFDVAGVTAATSGSTYSSGAILEDMGEVAKFKGQIFRRVRAVTQIPTGNITVDSYFIVMPGGEYPVQGADGVGVISTPAPVARLG